MDSLQQNTPETTPHPRKLNLQFLKATKVFPISFEFHSIAFLGHKTGDTRGTFKRSHTYRYVIRTKRVFGESVVPKYFPRLRQLLMDKTWAVQERLDKKDIKNRIYTKLTSFI
uniref:Uncharacterized protein n=1 Tax=Rhizophagus irregularis (strain DAOM 181602 / DAOM 197198 / MUCL 43194) TaxID=747089 RepID=U9SZX1_RHIID